jgi:hypothetical protein
MQLPLVTEVAPEHEPVGAKRVGWRVTDDGLEPLRAGAMLADGDPHASQRAAAAVALWIRDPTDAHRWGARGSDEIGGIATALDLGSADAFAIGAVRPFARTGGRAARVWVEGELRETGELAPDYAETVHLAHRRLSEAGDVLVPGTFLIAPVTAHVPVGADERVAVEIDGLGRLQA